MNLIMNRQYPNPNNILTILFIYANYHQRS